MEALIFVVVLLNLKTSFLISDLKINLYLGTIKKIGGA